MNEMHRVTMQMMAVDGSIAKKRPLQKAPANGDRSGRVGGREAARTGATSGCGEEANADARAAARSSRRVSRACGEVEEEETDVKLPVQPALLVAHHGECTRHGALGAAEREARTEDGDLHRLDDCENLEDHTEQRADHTERSDWVWHVHVLKKVPRCLDDASEGETGEKRGLCANRQRVVRVIVQFALLNLRHGRERQCKQKVRRTRKWMACSSAPEAC